MNKTFRLKVLAFCILISIFSVGLNVNAATESDFVTNDQLQNSLEKLKMDMATKEELQTMGQLPGDTLTKEEITQQLIDTQKSRIAILEGNINALLSLLAVIVAGLTLFGGIFVWISKKTFSSKVEEVELRLNQMKQLHNESITKIETVRELNSNLNVAIREAQDLHITLSKSKRAFDEEAEGIKQLRNYVGFLELKASRPEIIRIFENNVNQSNKFIFELVYWLEGTVPLARSVLLKATSVLGENLTKADEKIQDKLSFYEKSLKENEDKFWEHAANPLNWEDYEEIDIDDFEDPLNGILNDWEEYNKVIKKLHDIIKAEIKMNHKKYII
ncbi:hypothetical protein M2444_005593 [Paenibacillus sp. PastF-3]|uniref:hypothetical protein n=1 Tax=unclassified Paenibacillus TaxID=185978 RepID=UPI002477254B|nr:hypothetical protein [Paenibacillus sp. PastF-3]MDH6373750.1 hypothetical protein [Paenibacillus sp. PastF-3]